MSATIRKLTMSFPQKLIREPILHNISMKFGVVFNISRANVNDEMGYLELSLEGTDEALDQAIKYLSERGVTITES
ncbi:FeS-binding protein [bacterium]|nr:MAG: FeS-binding protein [bacterium]MBV6515327.1 hypothetical protein [Planctomycetota bacterium]NUO16996.1 NIL domain-containing protein [Planctomycetaceae bacterium]MCQ3950331.1 FeS-binding protein [Planctomycetota bacterium]RIK63045.1 MAG: FeS-binding protein [Planctomycetota bacterium]